MAGNAFGTVACLEDKSIGHAEVVWDYDIRRGLAVVTGGGMDM